MSLIIRALKKVKSDKNENSSVPPNMIGVRVQKKMNPRLILYPVLGVIMSLFLVYYGYYFWTGKDLFRSFKTKKKPAVVRKTIPAGDTSKNPAIETKPEVVAKPADGSSFTINSVKDKMAKDATLPDINSLRSKKVDILKPEDVKPDDKDAKKTDEIDKYAAHLNLKPLPDNLTVNKDDITAGSVDKKEKDEKKAAEKIEPVLKVDKKAIAVNNMLGDASSAMMNGEYSKAAELYKNILLKRKNADVLNNLIICLIRKGEVEEVQNLVDKHINLINEMIAANIVIEYSEKGIVSESKAMFDKLSEKINAENGELFYAGGMLYEQLGDNAKASLFFEKAYSVDNSDADYTYALGRSLELNKDYVKALNVYSAALAYKLEPAMREHLKARVNILSNYLESE